jgi:ABC-type cobalamin/Fe3+-siderophores transport system ATPase subunit
LTVPLSILINFVIADSKVLFPAPLIDSGTVKIEDKEMSLYRTDELAQKISILKQTNHTDMNFFIFNFDCATIDTH